MEWTGAEAEWGNSSLRLRLGWHKGGSVNEHQAHPPSACVLLIETLGGRIGGADGVLY
jgi:hypothetical protein